jgi:rhodanese-related sulfurtransferase
MPKNTAITLLICFFTGVLGKSRAPAAQAPVTHAISVKTVIQRVQEDQCLVLVDVREQRQFDRFNIPGSLNIALFAVKTKVFLKGRLLVLVDEGYRPHQLDETCAQLRQAGFDAWFLYGGLNAWRAHGAPLQGDVFARKALNKLPPQQFFVEQETENWLVIDVSASDNQAVRNLIPHTVSVSYQPHDQAAFLATLNTTIAQHQGQPWLSVLICDVRGEHYAAIERLIQHTDVKNVFFLKGGIDAYRQFVAQQERIKQGKEQGGDRHSTSSCCSSCN